MMERFTQKELRDYLYKGFASDLKNSTKEEIERLKRDKKLTKIGYSAGVYGCNGGLFRDCDNELYVVVGGCNNLWYAE